MNPNLITSESKFIERVRVALTNAEAHEIIKPLISGYGMDQNRIAEGWSIFHATKDIWERNKLEDVETKIASNDYKQTFDGFQSLFKRHRTQTLIFFKKEPDILISLGVNGKFPIKYNEFFDKTKMFYENIKNNVEIQNKMQLIKITPEIVGECLTKLQDLMAKRANYDKEFGESQEITKSKNTALIELQEWMEDFDAIAKVALFDQPQLLEVLGIFVRS